MILDTYLSTSF